MVVDCPQVRNKGFLKMILINQKISLDEATVNIDEYRRKKKKLDKKNIT